MRTHKRASSALFAAALLGALLGTTGCFLGGVSVSRPFSRTLPASATGRVALENVNGAIHIEAWDRPEVQVSAVIRARAGSRARAERQLDRVSIDVQPDGDGVRIQTRTPDQHRGISFSFGTAVSVEYTVQVPRQAALDIQVTNGGIELAGTQGRAALRTTNGGIDVRGTGGELTLRTTNGGLDIAEARGSVDGATINGGIDASFRDLGQGGVRLSTTNGGVDVRLPREVRATLDVENVHGGISSDFDVPGGIGKHRLAGDVNGGGETVQVRTVNGGVGIGAS
jgi:DUF4097 and DUF4098 domain-containing protein YvlB